MKIGILTQPLHTNYGGLLQAFALQQVLIRRGHEVLTVDIPFRRTKLMELKGIVYRSLTKILDRQADPIFSFRPTKEEMAVVAQHTRRFIKENIQTSERIPWVEDISRLKQYNFEAYVVGSDQVWRPKYSPGISTFFLDFLKGEAPVKRIAYAASFGTDKWEFKADEAQLCKQLAKRFDAISVREDSAVSQCREKFDVAAIQVPDPTLLLDQQDYVQLIHKDKVDDKKKSLMLYLLDQSPEKKAVVDQVNQELSLEVNSVMPAKKLSRETRHTVEDCVFPPVTEWLRGFMDAEFVVTDSFHGTIFSLIFQKPFLAIGNTHR